MAVTVLAGGAIIGRSQPDADSALQIVGRGVVSTAAPEFATTLTPDGSEIYFNRANADRTTIAILSARRTVDGGWSPPVVVPFSGTHRDVDPFVTPDGRRLYFSSDRPRHSATTSPVFATWYVERSGERWGAPIDPGPPLNSAAGDVFVSAARDGLLLFSSSRTGASRVYSAREGAGGWETPQPVSFGSVTDAGNPAIAPSGRFAVFVRAAAGGAADLFVSCRDGATWETPRALPAVNSSFADFAPSIDASERFLYFTSERPGLAGPVAAGARPPGDLYRIGLAEAGVRCR